MVASEWAAISTGNSPIERWLNKIRHLHRFLRGWAKNISGKYKKEKDRLLSIIDKLDIQEETMPLSDSEREILRDSNFRISNLRRDEETKWAQRAKVKHIQEGGNNTKYFHLIANGRHRKKKFFQLEQDEGTIVGEENLKVYITEYYKKLFGASAPSNISLVENHIYDIPQLSTQENDILNAPFSEEEVFEAISNMEHNKAPGPDGFPAEFSKLFGMLLREI
jgi:hypothetical protein